MSDAEILSMASAICYVLGGLGLALSLFFWFKFNILAVINDLSGRSAKKAREANRKFKEDNGGKGYKPSRVNAVRGKVTSEMKPGVVKQKMPAETDEEDRPETGLLMADQHHTPMAVETELLVAADAEETGLLVDENETVLLTPEPAVRIGGKKMVLLEEVIFIHTNESI